MLCSERNLQKYESRNWRKNTWRTKEVVQGNREEDATLRREDRECGDEEEERATTGDEEEVTAGERETLVEEQSKWEAAERETAIVTAERKRRKRELKKTRVNNALPVGSIWSHPLITG